MKEKIPSISFMLVLIVFLLSPVIIFGQYSFVFSTDEDFNSGSLYFKDDNLVKFASSFTLSSLFPDGSLPIETSVDAFGDIDNDTFIFSLDEDAEIAGTLYADEDLIMYDGGTFSLWFDGSAAGLPAEVNIDAVYIESVSPQIFQFSLGESAELSGIGIVSKNDILRYNNGTLSNWNQGSGWGISEGANLDALTKNPENNHYVFSLDIEDVIEGTTYKKGDLINFSGSAFTKFFDSTANGLDASINLASVGYILSEGISAFYTETFDTQGLWNFYTSGFQTGPSAYGGYDSVNKRIVLKSPSSGWSDWYSWQIPYPSNNIVTYTADTIYALKVKLSTDANTTIPLIRIRVQSSDFVWGTDLNPQCVNVDPTSVPELGVPTTTPQDFLLVWEPQGSTADAFIAFDEWEFGGTWTGELYVDEFNVYKIPNSQMTVVGEAISDITAFNTAYPNNWTTADGVTINPTNIAFTDTSVWHGVGRLVKLDTPMAPNDIYRIKYNLSKSGTDRVDDPRIRVNDSQNGGYATNITFDDTRAESTKHVEATAQDFILYHVAKNSRATVSGALNGYDLTIWCDQITKVPSSNATMYLNQIQIDKITLPPLN